MQNILFTSSKVILVLGFISLSFAQFLKEQNIYGWIDLQYEQSFPSEGNFGQPVFLDNISDISLTRVNLYYDFKPNKNTKALIEIGYVSNRFDDMARPKFVTGESYIKFPKIPGEVPMSVITQADSLTLSAYGLTPSEAQSMLFLQQAVEGQTIQDSAYSKRYGGILIERAWFDLNFSEQVNFRFGRYVNPVGIWNVDHGSPVLITARQPFQMSIAEIYPLSLDGAMFYGNHWIGMNELYYALHLSGGRQLSEGNRPQGFMDLGKGWRLKYNMDQLDGINVGTSGYYGAMRRAIFKSTPRVVLSTDALNQLGEIYSDQSLDVQEVGLFQEILGNSVIQTDLENEERVRDYSRELTMGVDLSVTWNQFSIQSEYNKLYVVNQQEKSENYQGVTELDAFYSIISYEQIINNDFTVTPYVLYEEIQFFQNFANPVVNFSYYPVEDWKNYFIGLNFGIFNNVRIKSEFGLARVDFDPEISSAPGIDKTISIKQFLTQFSMAF